MLRMPTFALVEPASLDAVLALLAEHGDQALLIAGGTDLLPNLKHELHAPRVVVSLARVPELAARREEADGTLVLGAMRTLHELATDTALAKRAPALAQAAGLVAGPQLRRMGTLGGNVMLDTRCQWINQTYFWRQALGFCLKKDGTRCHVVEGGANCVAAASNDSAPALMTLGARLLFAAPDGGRREVPIDELYSADGIWNKKVHGEVLVEVRLPRPPAGARGAYGKLRERGSIDFPLLGLAVRVDVEGDHIAAADLCAVALQARPVRLRKAGAALIGTLLAGAELDDAVERAAQAAWQQCRPLANIPGDPEYRREMIPVLVRRTVRAALASTGPVHPL
jgi:4-hydroxybenzoyl-CoA reductase subunit beta